MTTTPKVFIGTPIGSGSLMINYAVSLFCTCREFVAAGWDYPRWYIRVGDSDLCRARNAIIGYFLQTDCTDLVLIDSDISWGPGTLQRLINHDKDFVAGAYRGKTDEKDIYFLLWPEKKEMWIDPATEFPLLKVDGAPIGFCRLRRPCVEKLVASLNGKHYVDPLVPDEDIPWLIDFSQRDGKRLEEGLSLCRQWRDLGGDVWVDPVIKLGHMGPRIFDSDLMGFLEKMQRLSLESEPSESQKRIEEAWVKGAPVVAQELTDIYKPVLAAE